MTDLLTQLIELSERVTPGPFVADEDPMEAAGYKTLIVLPSKTGCFPQWIARIEHNWNDAVAGERRISWAEAQANAAFMALCMTHKATIILGLQALEREKE